MKSISVADELFFGRSGLNESKVYNIVNDSLRTMDDGELFLEFCQTESLYFNDGVLKNASFNTDSGFGFRSIFGETTGYAHSSELSEESIKRAAKTISMIHDGNSTHNNAKLAAPNITNKKLYEDFNPLNELAFKDKVKLLADIDEYIRSSNNDITQVTASLGAEWQAIQIIKEGNFKTSDIRPLVRINISVIAEKNGRMEKGSYGFGGRDLYNSFISEDSWQTAADKAIAQALVNLESIPAPAGEMPVILGPGWPGVLLHEAVGHGLEGDYNRKKTSAFSDLVGTQVAAKGVTVIDDGTIYSRRGSLTIDDEGTPSQRNTLIEDGILKGYMQDRLNAKLMGVTPTGNGRRESYSCQPLPRMTNTFMLEGDHSKDDIISSVNKGIYAVNFGGGQVDTTSGKFVFSASEAYLVENGQIKAPVKGATLIGNGPEAMKKITMIGNDLSLDDGIGTCGKSAQSVPVGVGQPTILVSSLTVGGTEI